MVCDGGIDGDRRSSCLWAPMKCCKACDYWDEERHKREMAEWVNIMKNQPRKPLYDFGWNLVHVPEPHDEERINR